MTVLGSGFRPRAIIEPPVQGIPSDTERVLAALADLSLALRAAQAPPPPPQIIIPEPDLGAIVTAVNGLKPGATADDVARAVVAQLAPPAAPGDNTLMSETLERVADSLKALDFRMQAPSAMIGGGILHMDPAQLDAAGNVKVANGAVPNLVGSPKYYSGAAGTVTPLAGERVMAVTAHATTAGTVTIFGGASIPVPANATFFDSTDGQWVGDGIKTIVFSGTDSYYVRVYT